METVAIIESIVTIIAIILGGAYVIFKLDVFRDLKPHLTVTQNVSHRQVGSKYVHVAVTASLHNSSKVAVELRNAFFRIQTVSPLSDEDIEALYEEAFVNAEHTGLWWPTLEEIDRSWDSGELIIEPGESHAETYEFIIGSENESVLIYAYIHNPSYQYDANVAEGWTVTTMYDMDKTGWSDS